MLEDSFCFVFACPYDLLFFPWVEILGLVLAFPYILTFWKDALSLHLSLFSPMLVISLSSLLGSYLCWSFPRDLLLLLFQDGPVPLGSLVLESVNYSVILSHLLGLFPIRDRCFFGVVFVGFLLICVSNFLWFVVPVWLVLLSGSLLPMSCVPFTDRSF